MPKKTKKPDESMLALSAALKRAMAVVDAEIGKGALTAGGYPVCLDVHIEGDITVGKASEPGEPKTVPAFNRDMLLAAIFHAAGDDGTALVGRAISKIKRAMDGGKAAEDLAKSCKACSALAEDLALKRGVTEEKQSPARKGAVSGKPSVAITGTAGAHSVEVELA